LEGSWGGAAANLTPHGIGIGYYDEAPVYTDDAHWIREGEKAELIMPFGEFKDLNGEDLKATSPICAR